MSVLSWENVRQPLKSRHPWANSWEKARKTSSKSNVQYSWNPGATANCHKMTTSRRTPSPSFLRTSFRAAISTSCQFSCSQGSEASYASSSLAPCLRKLRSIRCLAGLKTSSLPKSNHRRKAWPHHQAAMAPWKYLLATFNLWIQIHQTHASTISMAITISSQYLRKWLNTQNELLVRLHHI